jgi:hypothetical protein|uniref:Uncharacterized protein n=1 Tax=uncultured bacterium contig00111 TaxID=1181575 RepID=A0A806K310_9BACT|nr:hypothetical protein [uncultured bacterium contig00111]
MPSFLFILLSVALAFAATGKRILFSNPDITTSYSPLMLEKNSRADSLLPALNGDMALADLLAANPSLWSIENLRNEKNLSTKLRVNIIYIDGIREEAYCDFSKTKSAENWELAIGVDFVSGSSNTAAAHVYLCIEMARDNIGYATQDSSGKTLVIPPKQILEEIAKSEIPDAIPIDLQMKLLKAHKSVEEDGQCPKDIEAYLILLDVWKQVKDMEMDLPIISEALFRETVQTCAFNREWNKRYSETATFHCNSSDICEYNQSEDGKTFWSWNAYENRLEYQRKKILFFPYGKKSIHNGGTMLDLRITPLSSRLFLESYLNLKGEPISLGLIIVGD